MGLAVVDGFDQSHAVGALTFGLFVTAMTGMRLLGTHLLDRYGRVAVLRLCGALSIVGLLVFGLVPWLPARARRRRACGGWAPPWASRSA